MYNFQFPIPNFPSQPLGGVEGSHPGPQVTKWMETMGGFFYYAVAANGEGRLIVRGCLFAVSTSACDVEACHVDVLRWHINDGVWVDSIYWGVGWDSEGRVGFFFRNLECLLIRNIGDDNMESMEGPRSLSPITGVLCFSFPVKDAIGSSDFVPNGSSDSDDEDDGDDDDDNMHNILFHVCYQHYKHLWKL